MTVKIENKNLLDDDYVEVTLVNDEPNVQKHLINFAWNITCAAQALQVLAVAAMHLRQAELR